ncbi:MAG: glycosyltransferase family 2 protein [Candidatus Azobacteroides sp.]|nr:glycosyltransferase family 2 protein [Candidatus Azobacteroides sp.]
MDLSVGLITYNEENDLPGTLEAVKNIADEIIIVDNGSTDRTVEIAESYHAKVYVEKWKGFGPQKNSVIEKCQGKWILLIDADEVISPALEQRIREIVKAPASPYPVYKIRFSTICFGKEIKHGGWSNFYRVRLFINGAGKYDNRIVHETFLTTAKIGTIKEDIKHYTYKSLEEYFNKFNLYTSKLALQYHKRGKTKSAWNIFFSAKFKFYKAYLFKLGFLDGYEGYLLARISSMYILVKYSKLRELRSKR